MKPAEQHGAKVQGPDPICHFLEADVLAARHVAAVHPAAVPPDPAVRRCRKRLDRFLRDGLPGPDRFGRLLTGDAVYSTFYRSLEH